MKTKGQLEAEISEAVIRPFSPLAPVFGGEGQGEGVVA